MCVRVWPISFPFPQPCSPSKCLRTFPLCSQPTRFRPNYSALLNATQRSTPALPFVLTPASPFTPDQHVNTCLPPCLQMLISPFLKLSGYDIISEHPNRKRLHMRVIGTETIKKKKNSLQSEQQSPVDNHRLLIFKMNGRWHHLTRSVNPHAGLVVVVRMSHARQQGTYESAGLLWADVGNW